MLLDASSVTPEAHSDEPAPSWSSPNESKSGEEVSENPVQGKYVYGGCGNLPMGAIIADASGLLGNNLAEYATIYAYGKRYQMPAVATTDLMRMMGHIFPFTSLPWVLESCTSGFQKVTTDQFEAVNEHDRRKYRWKIVYYPHRIRLFWWYRDALMKEFRFRENLSGTDIYLLGDPRSEFPGVERDLALLAACNHTIFDYGTYGFFAAFLAGQRTCALGGALRWASPIPWL
ncbi:Galactoside 2-alpha-L-fucosyltransferase 1 [Amphibalanus amphitrite]|uniref:L-Fucosyltransferase n=1 Tax=Amphibalanus amphitrite TaxID=1232801 RepID=A0A6A4WZK8_AMPAM|nr:Galactoside 2-alpha-L-fucosyltransferase 1 [Amphibalanus amphitrite]